MSSLLLTTQQLRSIVGLLGKRRLELFTMSAKDALRSLSAKLFELHSCGSIGGHIVPLGLSLR